MDMLFIGKLDVVLKGSSTDKKARFSDVHKFAKPNDVRALGLMDQAARDTMELYPDIILAFGESDEYRHVCSRLVRCPFPT